MRACPEDPQRRCMDYPRKTGHLPAYMYLQLLGRTGADEHDLASGMDIPDKPRRIDHQRIGAPLGIEVQIAVDRHGEVKRLFLAGIADVEPADEGVLTI